MERAPIAWSVVGVGRAGRARARAIVADARCRLVAVHRGRFADAVDAPDLPLDEAIARADAVAVCSPTSEHATQVRRALAAGRHVVVEYPLAEDSETASALLALAHDVGRVLHVEHIELLDPAWLTLKAQLTDTPVQALEVHAERPGPSDADPHEIVLHQVARLHQLVGLVGAVRSIEEVSHGAGRLEARLRAGDDVPVSCRFLQDPERARHAHLVVRSVQATWRLADRALFRDEHPQTLLSEGPLFAQDHARAMARILDGRPSYVSEPRILHVLDVVDALSALQVGRIAPRPS